MRNNDFREYNLQVAGDMMTLLDCRDDPENFDVRLYRARIAELETTTEMPDVVGTLETNERAIKYDEPVETIARFVQYEWPDLRAGLDGAVVNEGSIEETPVVLLLREPNVPRQSVIEYDEYDDNDQLRTIRLYVLESRPYGRSPVICFHHFCIPMAGVLEVA